MSLTSKLLQLTVKLSWLILYLLTEKLIGFKSNAIRNTYFASGWEKIDVGQRKELEAEAARINENGANEMSEEKINEHSKASQKEASGAAISSPDGTSWLCHGCSEIAKLVCMMSKCFFELFPQF